MSSSTICCDRQTRRISIRFRSFNKPLLGQFGVKVSDIKTKQRDHAVLIPRQIAMYLCQELTEVPLSEIGQLFGGRNTATVQHAHKKIDRLMNDNAGITQAIHVLRKTLANMGVEITDISFPQGEMSRVCG